jgi:uncharacterized protein involved in type VI secretion and phage assembly
MGKALKLVAIGILSYGIGGCAVEKELRHDAEILSIYVEKIKLDTTEFADARDRVAKARTSTLNFLQAKTLRDEHNIQRDISAREVAQDKEWLALFDSLKKAADLAAKQRQEEKDREVQAADALTQAKGAVEVRGDKLTEASTALATLSEQQSRQGHARFFLSFIKQVNAGLETKKVNAKTAADASAAASKLKTEPK